MAYTHGQRWTDDKIKQAVMDIIIAENLDRMPSRKECLNYYGSEGLANAISRRFGGWYALAKELGYPVKKSETYLGKKHEEIACDMLLSRGFDVARMSQNYPYDILVDNTVKVDVKTSHLYKGKTGNFYTFNLEKRYSTCDVYILFTLDEVHQITNSYIIPSKFVPNNTQISIGERYSKYSIYRNRWDYISKYSDFFKSVV